MEYRILGPLEVVADDGAPVPLAGVRERTLLSILLLSPKRVVSSDRLIDLLWGDEPPASALNSVQVHVSRLRRKLADASNGACPISTEHPGYILRTLPGELDAERFEDLVRAAGTSTPEETVAQLDDALSLWRGELLSGLPIEVSRDESARLEELRLIALEQRIEARLTLGDHDNLVGELEYLVREFPLRERFHGELMLALSRCGRQAEALAVYRRLRNTLAEELGIDPSRALQNLELSILTQAPEASVQAVPGAATRAPARTGARATLTFLFTDMEGSTLKLSRLGEAYAGLLADHQRIVRRCLSTYGGREVSTAGDGFFAVFSSAPDCLSAMIEIQRQLAAHQWPADEDVRVRMGAHTGEASEETVGPVGLDVHKAARIAAVGHGGQMLVSAATAALVAGSLPDSASLRTLGLHRLKDFGREEEIFQLETTGLRTTFPPLRSLDGGEPPSNLPLQLTSFVGREAELAQLSELVGSFRLVTLTGVGGCGKTRLSLRLADNLLHRFSGGVWFVELAPVAEPEQVTAALATVIGVREVQGRTIIETLLDSMSERSILIVLDNCEHVVGACAKLVEILLRGCPNLSVVATSREPLGVSGESVYRVPPLTLASPGPGPVDPTEVVSSEAVQLFVARARSHNPRFTVDEHNVAPVVSICARLDGIPLAIELAAARLRSLSVGEIDARLADRFKLLTGGSRTALPRQRTLRALIDWSYDALNYRDRAVLDRSSVFAGGFDLATAEEVCAHGEVERYEVIDAIGSLVDKSLLHADLTDDSVRYRLLETIREYAAEKLGTNEASERSAREAHARAFLELAENGAAHIHGPDQAAWLDRIDADRENLRTAIAHEMAAQRTSEVLRFGVALREFWIRRGHTGDGLEALRGALDLPDDVPPLLRASAQAAAAHLCLPAGELAAATRFVDEGLSIASRIDAPAVSADLLDTAAWIEFFQRGESVPQSIDKAVEEARRSAQRGIVARVLAHRGYFAASVDPIGARADLDEAMAEFRSNGDLERLASALNTLGTLDLENNDLGAAAIHLEEGRELARVASIDEFMLATMNVALLAYMEGRVDEACRLTNESMLLCRDLGAPREHAYNLLRVALCLSATGDREGAVRLHAAADALLEDMGQALEPLEKRLRAEDHRKLRDFLGEADFTSLYDGGRHLGAHEATQLARQAAERLATAAPADSV